MLGSNILRLETGSYDTCTLSEGRDNLRDTLSGDRWQCNKAFTALRQSTTIHKVVLTTYAREDALTDTICTDLTCEVDLDSRVHSHNLRVLADILWVVSPSNITDNNAEAVVYDETFGNAAWPFEEYAYLCMIYDHEKFYGEITEFLDRFGMEKEIYSELLEFQKIIIKKPFDEKVNLAFSYNFTDYFMKLIDGKPSTLKKESFSVMIEAKPFESWAKFARIVAWYGRKDSFSTYIKQAYLERSNSENVQ